MCIPFALLVQRPVPLNAEVVKESTVQGFDVDVVVLEGSQNHYLGNLSAFFVADLVTCNAI
jgi:hypothetical protein